MESVKFTLVVFFILIFYVLPGIWKLYKRIIEPILRQQKSGRKLESLKQDKLYVPSKNLEGIMEDGEFWQKLNKEPKARAKIFKDKTKETAPLIPEISEEKHNEYVKNMKTEKKKNPWKGRIFKNEITRGIIMAEVLGKPRALKPFED